jgi:transposase
LDKNNKSPNSNITNFIILNVGIIIEGFYYGYHPLNSFKRHERKLLKLQGRLSRKKKKVLVKGKLVSGRNWTKAKRKVQKCQPIANIRRDFLHKTSTTIPKNHGVVVIEDLRVKNMSRLASGTLEAPGKNVFAAIPVRRVVRLKLNLLAQKCSFENMGRKRLNPSPPSEPCWRFSRTRLSS